MVFVLVVCDSPMIAKIGVMRFPEGAKEGLRLG
jgi:hypothetical protein